MIIGLTGPYCAGKNYVSNLMETRGFPALDVDKLGYEALELEKNSVFAQFGDDLQKSDGSIDRRLLGQRVFGKPDKLAALEAIVHPPVDRMVDEWITKTASPSGHYVINAALLHRAKVFARLDLIIFVTAPFLTRLLRARRRDKLPWKAILKRFASQKNFNSQYLSLNAEIYRVDNSGFSKTKNRVNQIIEKIRLKEIRGE